MASTDSQCIDRRRPTLDSNVVQTLLTDLYQITMCYAYWKAGKRNDQAVFDLFFRKNPFGGEFTIFAGLDQCLALLQEFKFSPSDITYLRTCLPAETDPEFFAYLEQLDASEVTVHAVREGSVVFPRVPLIRIHGPLPVVQLLETTLLTLVNFASLVATNASRFRVAAGPEAKLLEFGLRRAQGPDGGLSASKYCYVGGFDSTSNVLAGKQFGIPTSGTHAHAFVSSFRNLDEAAGRVLQPCQPRKVPAISLEASSQSLDTDEFLTLVQHFRADVCRHIGVVKEETNDGELAAFISYALAFPSAFLALIDTYDVMRSGLPNFICVALALGHLGYLALGIRLDSGDLSYSSKEVRRNLQLVSKKLSVPWLEKVTIVASNDINEDTLNSLNAQGHCIDAFGIGTHLVTCQRQPALGCVFKLVELNGKPCMKLSQDVAKVTLPGSKPAYRLYGSDDCPLLDLMTLADEPAPCVGQRVLCRHPFQESRRAYVNPSRVERLYHMYWSNGQVCTDLPTLEEVRTFAKAGMAALRADHQRPLNPTPYKVSVTDGLYQFTHRLWLEYAPIGELS
ncbi:nicotinate phosphoribosyltransferase-like [Sycon ciliatum]|uniref:nicotinate phosphoribosyltransferase-like n=1 Tax=Sycon ciliatum TaxID=27933 RepID=UPI0020A840DC